MRSFWDPEAARWDAPIKWHTRRNLLPWDHRDRWVEDEAEGSLDRQEQLNEKIRTVATIVGQDGFTHLRSNVDRNYGACGGWRDRGSGHSEYREFVAVTCAECQSILAAHLLRTEDEVVVI